MSRDTAASFFIPSPLSGKSPELYQVLLRRMESYHELSRRFIRLAEQAHAFRRFDQVKEYGQVLSHVPIKDYQAVGTYFLAVATNCNGKGDQSEAWRLFEVAMNTAPDAYKVKAILSLGALSFNKGDFDASLYFYHEGLKNGKLSAAGLHAIRAISVFKAMEGNHAQAVRDIDSILPVIKYAPAHVYFDILNSYAVELGEVGRTEEARRIARAVVASPFTFAYPEWKQTAEELRAANRSSVVIGALPYPSRNVLFLPVEHARRQSSAEWTPAPVLDFQKWKAKMLRSKKVQTKKTRVTERDMLIRVMEIFTSTETTDDQKRQIWEAAERVVAVPSPLDPDNPAS